LATLLVRLSGAVVSITSPMLFFLTEVTDFLWLEFGLNYGLPLIKRSSSFFVISYRSQMFVIWLLLYV
jgi:hypothetical protein